MSTRPPRAGASGVGITTRFAAGQDNPRSRDLDATLEDLTWLADHHVGATEAARRTDFPSVDALEKWLRNHCRNDLMNRLRAHDPIKLARHQRDPYHLERSA